MVCLTLAINFQHVVLLIHIFFSLFQWCFKGHNNIEQCGFATAAVMCLACLFHQPFFFVSSKQCMYKLRSFGRLYAKHTITSIRSQCTRVKYIWFSFIWRTLQSYLQNKLTVNCLIFEVLSFSYVTHWFCCILRLGKQILEFG